MKNINHLLEKQKKRKKEKRENNVISKMKWSVVKINRKQKKEWESETKKKRKKRERMSQKDEKKQLWTPREMSENISKLIKVRMNMIIQGEKNV